MNEYWSLTERDSYYLSELPVHIRIIINCKREKT